MAASQSQTPPLSSTELVGYARVSTSEQDLALQLDALTAAGCQDRSIFRDVGSGSIRHRPQLDACLHHLRTGDTLIVWRLDRLGRGLRHLIETIAQLEQRQIAFRSLTENIDTSTASGRLQLHLFAALAEFERELIRERTRAGLDAARARGRRGGRPTVVTRDKLAAAIAMRKDPNMTMDQIAKALKVSRSALYRQLGPALEQERAEQTQRAA